MNPWTGHCTLLFQLLLPSKEGRVAAAIAATKKPTAAILAKGIKRLFAKEPASAWRDEIKAIVAQMRSGGRWHAKGQGQA